jgi:hypothetical protein
VKVIEFPTEPARTVEVGVVSVPLPSVEFVTVIDGELASAVRVPPAVDFSVALHVCEPVDDEATAPEPPDAVDPYVTVTVAPAASESESTVIVCPATETVPLEEVV